MTIETLGDIECAVVHIAETSSSHMDKVGDGCDGPLKASMRLFHASTASRSACLRASSARSAAALTDAP